MAEKNLLDLPSLGLNIPPVPADSPVRAPSRALINFPIRAVANAVAAAGPDPRLSEVTGLPKFVNYIPLVGLGEGMASMAGFGYDVFRTLANKGLESGGYETRLPPQWQWTQTAGEQIGKTTDEITKQLGGDPVDPTDFSDVVLGGLAAGIGGGIPLGPGGIVKGLATAGSKIAPSVGKFAYHTAKWLPTTEHMVPNMAVMGTLGTALGAHQGYQFQKKIEELGLTPEQARQMLKEADDAAATAVPGAGDTSGLTPSTTANINLNQPGVTTTAPSKGTQVAALDVPSLGLTAPASLLSAPGAATTAPSTRVDDPLGLPSIKDSLSPNLVAPTFEPGGGHSGMSVLDAAIDLGILVAGVGAARFFHGIGAGVTKRARDLRAANPDYVTQSADYNNKIIAKNGGDITTGPNGQLPQAPLPPQNPFHKAVTAIQNDLLDHTAKLQDVTKSMAENPSGVELLNRQFANVHNDSMHQVAATELAYTGHDSTVNFQFEQPPQRLYNAIVALEDAKQKTLMDGLYAQSEMVDRNINARTNNGNPLPYHFPHASMADLHAYEAKMLADPQLADFANRYHSINRQMPELGERYGYHTVGEVKRLQQERPKIVFDTDHTGKLLQTFGKREGKPYTGNDVAFTTPWGAQMQHFESLYRDYRANWVNNMVTNAMEKYQHDYPNAAKLVTERKIANLPQYGITPGPNLNPTNQPIVIVRDSHRGARALEIHHKGIYDMLSGENTTRQRAAMGALSTPRRIFTQGTTGVASMLSGRLFPLIPGLRTLIDTGINRPKGSYGGLMDMAMQKATGGRLGYRGLDPTSIVGALAYSLPRRRIEATAAMMGRVLDPISPNPFNRYLRAMIGDTPVNAISKSLDKFYKEFSVLHEQRGYGVSGQANLIRSRLPGWAPGSGSDTRSVFNELVPEVMMSNGVAGKWRPRWINTRVAVERFYSALNEYGHDFFWDMNQHNKQFAGRPDVLAYETRHLTGDPGTGGNNRYVQGFTSAVPYANITMQGLARRGRAFAETPIGTSMAYIGTMGSLAALSLWTAMGRPDAIEYLENVLSTTQRVSNVYLFQAGKPADQHIALSLSQEDSVFFGLVLDVLAKGMNLFAIRGMPDAMAGWGKFLDDYLHEHIMNSSLESVEHGLQRGIGLDIPALNAVTGFFGDVNISPDFARIWDDYKTGNLSSKSFTRGTGTFHGSPNHPSGDGVFDSVEGKKYSDLFGNLLGLAGTVTDMVGGFSRYWNQTDDFWGSLGKAGHDWLEQVRDFNPSMNNLLWENAARSSRSPPVVEYNRQRMDAMKLTVGVGTAATMEDTTGGRRGIALPMPASSGQGMEATDPQLAQIQFDVSKLHSYLEGNLVAQANALKKQIDAVQSQGLPPEERRRWVNDHIREMADKWRIVGGYIDDMNGALSRKYGRQIDIGKKIDWKGDMNQFPLLQQ